MPRTILWGESFFAMLVGLGVAVLPARLGYCVIALIFVGGTGSVVQYYDEGTAESVDWRSAAASFMENKKPAGIILFRTSSVASPFLYYVDGYSSDWEIRGWECDEEVQWSGKINTSGPIPGVKWAKSGPEPESPIPPRASASLWVVEARCSPESGAKADAPLFLHWKLRKSYDFKGGYLHHLVTSVNR